jgi:2-haloacid dehalogenase
VQSKSLPSTSLERPSRLNRCATVWLHWASRQLRLSCGSPWRSALAASDSLQPFAAILESALDQVVRHSGLKVTPSQRREILDGLKMLPPHREARQALEEVKAAGRITVALTNGAAKSTRSLLESAELMPLFDQLISVDDVGALKPRKEVYRYAARSTGAAAHNIGLVSTHPWDLHGAKMAGLATGFVARSQPFPATMREPDVVGEDLRKQLQRGAGWGVERVAKASYATTSLTAHMKPFPHLKRTFKRRSGMSGLRKAVEQLSHGQRQAIRLLKLEEMSLRRPQWGRFSIA